MRLLHALRVNAAVREEEMFFLILLSMCIMRCTYDQLTQSSRLVNI